MLTLLLVAFFLCLQFLIRFWVVTVVHIEIVCNSGGAFGISLPVWLFILIDSLVVIVMAMVWWKRQKPCFWMAVASHSIWRTGESFGACVVWLYYGLCTHPILSYV